MPRRETELPVDEVGPVMLFARALRRLRHRAGTPTYREMGRRTHYSHTALSRAARGKRLPTWEVTRAFIIACNDEPERWRKKHNRAANAATAASPLRRAGRANSHNGKRRAQAPRNLDSLPQPQPVLHEDLELLLRIAEDLIQGASDDLHPSILAGELRKLKEASGLSIRQIGRLTELNSQSSSAPPLGPLKKIPISTIGDLFDVDRASWPNPDALRAILAALEVPVPCARTIIRAVEVTRSGALSIPPHLAKRITGLLTAAEAGPLDARVLDLHKAHDLLTELEQLNSTAPNGLTDRIYAHIGELNSNGIDHAGPLAKQLSAAYRQGRLGSQRAEWIGILDP